MAPSNIPNEVPANSKYSCWKIILISDWNWRFTTQEYDSNIVAYYENKLQISQSEVIIRINIYDYVILLQMFCRAFTPCPSWTSCTTRWRCTREWSAANNSVRQARGEQVRHYTNLKLCLPSLVRASQLVPRHVLATQAMLLSLTAGIEWSSLANYTDSGYKMFTW